MRIGVIGPGNVGGTLGRGWVKYGHEVKFGAVDPFASKVQELIGDIGAGASAGTVAEAAAFGDVVALTTPWPAARAALLSAGDLTGKIVLDCTNPLKTDLSGLETEAGKSAAEQIAEWASGARVVKIFNTTGFNNMANPDYNGKPITMFYAGDDAEAKRTAARLAADLGFDPVDAGPLSNAGLLEHLAMLWIYLAVYGNQGRDFALTIVRR